MLSDDSDWGYGAAQAFIDAHVGRAGGDASDIINAHDTEGAERTYGFSLAALLDGTLSAETLLRRLDEMGARVVYLVAQPTAQEKIYSTMHRSGVMRGAGYAWITAWVDEDSMRDIETGEVSHDAIRGAEGVIGMLESYNDDAPLHQAFRERFIAVADSDGCHAPGSYCDVDDGDRTMASSGYSMGQAEAMLLTLKAYDANDNYRDAAFRADPEALYQAMKALGTRPGYDGVSGSVVLDASGDRLGTYDVFNLQLSTARRARERRLHLPR